jgi:DNA-directed RNA polymerase subunit RPC12/RpoP
MKYVVLTTVDDIFHAQLLGRELEEAGIPSIEANVNTATILPSLQQGIQIRVKETDFLRAKVISDRVEKTRLLHCPKCDSNEVVYKGTETKPLTLFEQMARAIAGKWVVGNFMLIYQCSNCGTTFKTK